MTGAPTYPSVDPRRVGALRRALLRDIAAMAPAWRGAAEAQGPDRALVEIAARLSEEATRRLDKTPERDALAFLEMFDIAPPQPVAARGVTVFALKPGQTSPVTAKARTGVTIATQTPEGGSAAFETTQNLRIQPGHIAHLATVDPARDQIGLAPQAVTTLDPDLTDQPLYTLLTGAGAGDSILSLAPPVGILPGDLLRIEGTDGSVVFADVTSFSEDGLTQMAAPLGTALTPATVARVERMQRLDAFQMPDAQEHALYIGDPDVLTVKEPATFALRFDPPEVAALLSREGALFEIWGTRETPVAEEAPAWHPLVRLASTNGDLKLFKAWTGPVDEVEVAGRTARWIRVRPRDAIVPQRAAERVASGQRTMVDQVTLGVETITPDGDSDDTISQIAYNAAPLSVAAPFLPFGPEPLRFDVFAIAAPEAFTKPDARATLDFTVMDATLLAVTAAQRFDGREHVYGIGSNGRLQVLDVTEETLAWIEVAGPPVEPGAEQTFGLDPDAGLLAYAERDLAFGRADDLVVVSTTTGARFVAHIIRRVGPGVTAPVALQGWFALPDLPDGTVAGDEIPGLAVQPQQINGMARYEAALFIAAQSGVLRIEIPVTGNTSGRAWVQVDGAGGPDLPLSPTLALVPDEASSAATWMLSVAQDGQIWALRLDGAVPTWHALETQAGDPMSAASRVTPAGATHGPAGARRLAVATLVPDAGDLRLAMTQYDITPGPPQTPETHEHGATGFAASSVLTVSRALALNTEQLPHVLGLEVSDGVVRSFEWAPTPDRLNRAAAGAVFAPPRDQESLSAAMFLPRGDQRGAKQVFAAASQTVVSLPINPAAVANFGDWIAVPPAPVGTQVLVSRVNALSGLPELITGPLMLTPLLPGPQVAVFDPDAAAGETDWGQDITAYRAGDPVALDYVGGADALVDTGGAGTLPSIGDRILIIPDDAPQTFGIFQVSAVGALSEFVNPPPNPDPDALQVSDPVALEALMNGGTGASLRQVVPVATIPGLSDGANRGTLVGLGAVPFWPAQISGFTSSDALIDVSDALMGPGGTRWVTRPAFNGPAPANGTLIKLVEAGGSPETMQATALTQSYSNPELSWEYFDGEGWKRLDKGFQDTTLNFANSGAVSFVVPRDLSVTEIGGQEDYWIRARLVGGDYGRPRYIVETTPTTQEVTVSTDHMRPPEVSRVSARVLLAPDHVPEQVIARNNMRDLDQSAANRIAGAAYPMFEGAYEVPMGAGGQRALLLGFTQPLVPGLATLFVTARDQAGHVKLKVETLGADTNWSPAPLTGADPTNGLLRGGLITLSVTAPPAHVQMFGKTLYWMRLSPAEGGADWAPQITGLWLNGVRVVQAETVRQELMGGASGKPDLELSLLKPPVLAGSLELRVRETLSDEETRALRASQARDMPDPVTRAPNLAGDWVLWHQVASLTDQPPDARVYVLDAQGKVRFGDGQNGRIVLAGRDNIRAFSYLTGGQRVETAAFADAKPRGSLEGLDKVLAPAPIAGGSARPDAAELVARMPQVLRHANMGLSLSDIEALARDLDSQIVQVKGFAPTPARDAVLLAVLARGKTRTPIYSLAQRDALRAALVARMTDAFRPDCLSVVSVRFAHVALKVDLLARPGALAALESDAGDVLGRFLHAADGGPDGRGWPPGRPLWPNDIRRALAAIPALDRILQVEVAWVDGRSPGTMAPDEVITTADTRAITVTLSGEADR